MSSKFAAFLAHHASDLHSIANALGSVLDALPVNRQDRERISATIDKVSAASKNILDSLDTLESGASDAMTTGKDAVASVSKGDVEKAIASALPGLVASALADHLAKHPLEAKAPVIAPGTPGPKASVEGDKVTGTASGVSSGDTQTAQGDGSGDIVKA